MIANFKSQLGWTWCPEGWSNIISDVSVRIFWDEISIQIGGPGAKQVAFHNVGKTHPISGRPNENKKNSQTRENSPADWPWTSICNISPSCWWPLDSEWNAGSCWLNLQILDLPLSIIISTNYLKQISLSVFLMPTLGQIWYCCLQLCCVI